MFTAQKEKDDLSGSKKHAADDLRSGAYRAGADVYDTAAKVTDDVEGMMRNAGERVRDLADRAGHATETVTTKIRDNPVQSSFIALGVGFLIGSLFRR